MNNEIYIYILISLMAALVLSAIVLIIRDTKKANKDWEAFNELEKQVKAVSTKKEANSLYVKVSSFQRNINNSILQIRLNYLFAFLDGFLKAKENE